MASLDKGDFAKYSAKSFHLDNYCFDSNPEMEFFKSVLKDEDVDKVYFTGMLTSDKTDFCVSYIDPESNTLRNYYPDFLAKMEDGSYQLIEVKGDNKIDDEIVKAKAEAAEEMAVASGVEYKMYAGSKILKTNILDTEDNTTKVFSYSDSVHQERMLKAAENITGWDDI